jgi:DNA-binding Lrp family transcriptional regulator
VAGLDPTDKKILDELSFDCRLSYRELAKRVGLSTTAVIRRVNALIDDGTIHNFVVIPTRNMAGTDSFIAIIHTDSSENLDEFVSMIGSTHKFIQVSQLISPRGHSFFLTGRYTSFSDLMEIGRFLRALDGVEEVEIYHIERKRKTRALLGNQVNQSRFSIRQSG